MFKKLQDKLFPSYEANRAFMNEHNYDYTLRNHIGYVSFLRFKNLPVLSVNDMVEKTTDNIINTIHKGVPNVRQTILGCITELCACVKGLNKATKANFALSEVGFDFQDNNDLTVQIAIEPKAKNRGEIYTMRRD